jgi:hypothetical protein
VVSLGSCALGPKPAVREPNMAFQWTRIPSLPAGAGKIRNPSNSAAYRRTRDDTLSSTYHR